MGWLRARRCSIARQSVAHRCHPRGGQRASSKYTATTHLAETASCHAIGSVLRHSYGVLRFRLGSWGSWPCLPVSHGSTPVAQTLVCYCKLPHTNIPAAAAAAAAAAAPAAAAAAAGDTLTISRTKPCSPTLVARVAVRELDRTLVSPPGHPVRLASNPPPGCTKSQAILRTRVGIKIKIKNNNSNGNSNSNSNSNSNNNN